MKTFIKTSCVAALTLAAMTFGAPQAQAWGGHWPIGVGIVGGVAVGTTIGATVACASTPVYYAAPPVVYTAPRYCAPAPVAVRVAAVPPCYPAPRVVCAAPLPYRVGYALGPRYFYGGRYYRR